MLRRRRARLEAAALGPSHGGLTSKVHLAADRRCRPSAFVLTPRQAADSPRFVAVLEEVRVGGPVCRPRTRPDAVAAEEAYSSWINRAYLRKRKVKAVIPEKVDQAPNRSSAAARAGGRSPTTRDHPHLTSYADAALHGGISSWLSATSERMSERRGCHHLVPTDGSQHPAVVS
ncbi:hypothetical protein GCM10010193_67960 [Kitasatospora atroaurantiaca]